MKRMKPNEITIMVNEQAACLTTLR